MERLVIKKLLRKIELLEILVKGCRLHPAYRAIRPATGRCLPCVEMWSARQELNDLEVKNPTIIAFGNDTYDIIKRNIQGINILKIPHYAHQINKEKYRTQIQNILKF